MKTTIFLKDLGDFAAVNEVYGAHFTGSVPARATVEVSRLPRDVPHTTYTYSDNGVLTFAARRTAVLRAIELDRPDWFLPCVSRTFHGRDIFAPVAAWLATGRPVHEAGSPVDDWTELRRPAPVRTASASICEREPSPDAMPIVRAPMS